MGFINEPVVELLPAKTEFLSNFSGATVVGRSPLMLFRCYNIQIEFILRREAEVLLRTFFESLFSAIFPFRCHVCEESTEFGSVICEVCRSRLRKMLHPPVQVGDTICDFPVYTLSSYDSFAADIIRIIKYRPSFKLLKILAEECLTSSQLSTFFAKEDVLVSVPMHAGRLAQRGFNQAEFLAERFAATAGCHFSPALQRTRMTRPQADCDEQERLTNLEQAFAIGDGLVESVFRGRRIILVDDVATTGTTLGKCAEVLRRLKPAQVCAVTVAHSFRHIADPSRSPKL